MSESNQAALCVCARTQSRPFYLQAPSVSSPSSVSSFLQAALQSSPLRRRPRPNSICSEPEGATASSRLLRKTSSSSATNSNSELWRPSFLPKQRRHTLMIPDRPLFGKMGQPTPLEVFAQQQRPKSAVIESDHVYSTLREASRKKSTCILPGSESSSRSRRCSSSSSVSGGRPPRLTRSRSLGYTNITNRRGGLRIQVLELKSETASLSSTVNLVDAVTKNLAFETEINSQQKHGTEPNGKRINQQWMMLDVNFNDNSSNSGNNNNNNNGNNEFSNKEQNGNLWQQQQTIPSSLEQMKTSCKQNTLSPEPRNESDSPEKPLEDNLEQPIKRKKNNNNHDNDLTSTSASGTNDNCFEERKVFFPLRACF